MLQKDGMVETRDIERMVWSTRTRFEFNLSSDRKWCISLLHFNEDLESFIICCSLEGRICVHHVFEFEICVQKSTSVARCMEQYVLTMCNHFLCLQFARC